MRKTAILFAIGTLLVGGCGSCNPNAVRKPIAADDLAALIESGSSPLVLDVRTRDEFSQGHIPGAINIPHDELSSRLSELPLSKSGEIVVHCQSGRRAQLAEQALLEGGYSNVRDLVGHWQGWLASELPTD